MQTQRHLFDVLNILLEYSWTNTPKIFERNFKKVKLGHPTIATPLFAKMQKNGISLLVWIFYWNEHIPKLF